MRTLLSLLYLMISGSVGGCIRHSSGLPGVEAQSERRVREFLRIGTAELRTGTPESLQKAEAYYELALELRPEDPRALDGLGSVAFRLENLPEAEWFFTRAYRSNPQYDRAIEHLAAAAKKRQDLPRAIALLREAIRINPLNYRARNNLAVCLTGFSGNEGDAAARSQLLKARGIFEQSFPEVPDEPALVEENLAKTRREN